jgi:FkbM family methyltransferase
MINIINFLKEKNIKSVLDIGANVGNWSSYIKQELPYMEIFCIEANPACEKFLIEKNLNYNIACLSDTNKNIKFYIDPTTQVSTGCSYYLENTKYFIDESYIILETKKLDHTISNFYEYIKLDTQGSEIDIIKGGKNVISNAKYIHIETSIIEYNKNAPLKEEVFQFLKDLNFKPLYLVENHYMDGNLIQEDFIFENKNL